MTARLRLSAGHHHFDHRAAPIVATAYGWFAQEGLGDVTIGATGEDDRTVAGLYADDIDIGLDISPTKVIADHVGGGDLVIVGSMANGVGQVLTGVRTMRTVEDLRGRRIHVVERGSGVDWHPLRILLRILLRKRGIDPDRDVKLVFGAPYPLFRHAQGAFEAGIADARMVLHEEIPQIEAAGYPVLLDFMAEYPSDYPQRTIVVRRAFLERQRATLEAFLHAMVRGYRYLRDEQRYGEAMALMRRQIDDEHLGFPPGITAHFLSKHYFGFKQMPHDGGVSVRSLQRLIDEEALEGRMLGPFDARAILDAAPVRAAAAAIDADYAGGYR